MMSRRLLVLLSTRRGLERRRWAGIARCKRRRARMIIVIHARIAADDLHDFGRLSWPSGLLSSTSSFGALFRLGARPHKLVVSEGLVFLTR